MRRIVLPALLLVTVASCRRPTEVGGPLLATAPATTTTTCTDPPDTTSYPPGYNDPGLQEATNVLKPLVEGEFRKHVREHDGAQQRADADHLPQVGQDGSALKIGMETNSPKDFVQQLAARYPGMSFKLEMIGPIRPLR